MRPVRRLLTSPPRTRALASAAVLALALAASATGQAAGLRLLAGLGFVLFPWGAGFLLLSAGDHYLLAGRTTLGEELRRGVAWLFLAFVGWSTIYAMGLLPTVLVLYEALVVGTAAVVVGVLVVVRSWTDLGVGPSSERPSKRQVVLRSLPLVAVFLWWYASGDWGWRTTFAFALTVAALLVVAYRPDWLPGVSRDLERDGSDGRH